MSKDQKLNFAENFALSGVAAVTSKTIAAPIERIKLLVQNEGEMLKQGIIDKPYNGPLDCAKRTLAREGLGSFWLGNTANCLRYFPTQALNFAFKGKIKQMFNLQKTDSYTAKFAKNIGSGGAAGALSLAFVYSLDFARTKLANQDKANPLYNGLIDVYKKTLASDGIGGLYRGFVISAVGIVVYRGAYFGLYDSIQPIVLGEDASVFANFVLGYAVTVASGIISYPIDTIRRRMMMTSGQAVKYNGSLDCAKQILKNEGVASMFKGAGANVLRGVAGAGVLAGFDKFKKLYIDWRLTQ